MPNTEPSHLLPDRGLSVRAHFSRRATAVDPPCLILVVCTLTAGPQVLKTTPHGLSAAEAASRLQQYGPNALTPPKKTSFLGRLWAQINNMVIWILIAAAIVDGAFQEWAELGLIIGVVVLNVAIGMAQEGKAEKAAEALKAMLSAKATVVRDGERISVEADQLVPGEKEADQLVPGPWDYCAAGSVDAALPVSTAYHSSVFCTPPPC